jgi:glycosyltransferase involved in cell wall biosynthesis
MGWRPLVSVVMPSLDQGSFIESAVLSVLGQGGQNVELIVADGGSKDGTLELLGRLAHSYEPRLSWSSEADAGPANAVNKAIGRARGEIIGWLNSDDGYAPDAIARACDFFAAHPAMVMVYGEGEHIDAHGQPLGHYPTRPPTATLADFQSGCFICQPTVFLRRSALDEVGLLDEGLATAFDFDLWLRLFQRFPGRIGFIDQVLAFSRLHTDCITLKQRRLVATEAVSLLAKYLGQAEDHWVRTYVNELLEVYPFGGISDHLKDHVDELVRELEDGLGSEVTRRLRDDLSRDARLQLASPGVYAHVYPDGWAPPVLEVRVAGRSPGWERLCLECDHAWPIAAPLDLRLCGSWGWGSRIRIEAPGAFGLEVPLDGAPWGQGLTLSITTDQVFVPNQFPGGGDDGRGLAFLVRRLWMTDIHQRTQVTIQ